MFISWANGERKGVISCQYTIVVLVIVVILFPEEVGSLLSPLTWERSMPTFPDALQSRDAKSEVSVLAVESREPAN